MKQHLKGQRQDIMRNGGHISPESGSSKAFTRGTHKNTSSTYIVKYYVDDTTIIFERMHAQDTRGFEATIFFHFLFNLVTCDNENTSP